MKILLQTIILTLILVTTGFYANAQNDEQLKKDILGKWQLKSAKTELTVAGKNYHDLVKFIEDTLIENENIFEFEKGGKLSLDGDFNLTYTIENGILEMGDEELRIKFKISVKSNTLTFTANKQLVWMVIQENGKDIEIDGKSLSSIINNDDVKLGLVIQFTKI